MRALLRNAILGLAACVALAMPAAAATGDKVDVAELMKPSPLGEKSLGDPKAPVTMIEYASLTCSHCGAFYQETFDKLKEKYIDTGKVYFILREFPLDELALAAIMAARCVPEDQFFPVVDRLFREQKDWAYVDNPGPALVERLEKHGLGMEALQTCLENKDLQDKIIAIENEASAKFGVDGTPAFFFNGVMHGGVISIEEIDALIAPMLPKT